MRAGPAIALILSFAVILARISFAADEVSAKSPRSQPSTVPGNEKELDTAYQALRARIAAHNKEVPVSDWLMNSEHLFVEDDSLRDPVIQYSRKPGGLDFLFAKVLDAKTSSEDLLVISEILVYFGGHPEPGDEGITANFAGAAVKAVANGRAVKADAEFNAPVGRKIREAAEKTLENKSKDKNG